MARPTLLRATTDQLRTRRGRIGNYVEEYLEVGSGSWDVVRHFDDFLGDEIMGSGASPGMYQLVTGVDGALAIEDATVTNGEVILSASVGNGANAEHAGVAMGLNYRGEQNPVIYARIQLDTLATSKVEFGFTDAVGDAGAVSSLAGNTFTATDAALWVYDTDDNTNWQAVATPNGDGSAITKDENTTNPGSGPTAATYQTLVVALRDTFARFIRFDADGGFQYDTGWLADAISADVDVTPWLFVQLRTDTIDRNITMDFWGVHQRRSSSN